MLRHFSKFTIFSLGDLAKARKRFGSELTEINNIVSGKKYKVEVTIGN